MIFSHADGSIKFWDASGCNLLFLYKLRTNRLFDRVHSATSPPATNKETNTHVKLDARSSRTNSNIGDDQHQQINFANPVQDINGYENPFAIYSVKTCCDGKYLVAAARGGHVTLFKFTGSELEKADEGLGDLTCIEIPILHRNMANDRDETSAAGLNDSQSRQSTEKKVCNRISRGILSDMFLFYLIGFQKFTPS